jgi:hypothetical protein
MINNFYIFDIIKILKFPAKCKTRNNLFYKKYNTVLKMRINQYLKYFSSLDISECFGKKS